MSLRAYVIELQNIKEELKRLRSQVRRLNKRKAEVESEIVKFLEEKELPGVKFQGTSIVAESKERRGYKKPQQKKEDGVRILENYGIRDASEVLDEVIEAMKGERQNRNVVKIQTLRT